MADYRMSSVLPTIKCSMCSREIEISQMGDHVCRQPAEPTPPLDSYGGFDTPYKQKPTNGPPLLKPGRLPPPRVDTSAANRPFFRTGMMTPISASSEPRSQSPRDPIDGRRSPFGRSQREQIRPPSPEILSSNLDSAFPPFPAPKQPSKRDQAKPRMQLYAEADPMYAPVSPMVSNAPMLQRMKSIAPGPFDVNGKAARRVRTPDEETRKAHQPQPSTTSSGHSRSSTSSSSDSKAGTVPIASTNGTPKVGRAMGYGGVGPQLVPERPQFLKPENRSQTFPANKENRTQNLGVPRRPSEPASEVQRPSIANQSLSPPKQRQPAMAGPDRSRPLPPRGASLIRKRDPTTGEAPPMPNLAKEFGASNPYHTPSASESSNGSSSSRSSPQRANGYRKPSDTSNIDSVMKDIQSAMLANPPSAPQEQFAKPMAPFTTQTLSPPPESPMDPAMAGGRLSPMPAKAKIPADPQRRPTTAKGNCKGCGEAIKGKSVSSADGRLTGRYHKHCFVCKTCHEPFATATFYVIDNAPYCERHYHKLNGSVCHSCDKGIEGQYLETERKQKYHPTCLTCSDCRRVLRDDYFEMNGRVYCERDAYRKAQQRNFLGTGTNRMERRTTRLMMM